MGIRSAGVFCYLNTTRWLRALGIPTGPKTIMFQKACSKYGCCILDLTLCIHTICLSQAAEMFKQLNHEEAVELVLDKIRSIVLAKLKATNLVVLCLDSPVGGLKFAVSAQRAHHRAAWDDSTFVSMLKDPTKKEHLFASVIRYMETLALRPKQTVVVIQRHENGFVENEYGDFSVFGGAMVSGAGGSGWFKMASGNADSDEYASKLKALFQDFLNKTEDTMHYESDMLCYQVSEMLPDEMLGGLPVLVESKDTDMAAIFMARSCDESRLGALRRTHLLFRSFKKFVDVDMDASLNLALGWIDVQLAPSPFVTEAGYINGCPDPATNETEALLWLLDFEEWTPLVDDFLIPSEGIKTFLEVDEWRAFLRSCARTFTRGPLFRRTLLYMSSCVKADSLKTLCGDMNRTGQPVYELVTASLGLSDLKLQNDGFCNSKETAVFTFSSANKTPVKDKKQSVACVMNLTHLLYASDIVPRATYQRYCEERYNMLDDNGVCMTLDPESTASACCTAAVGLSMYGTDYTNGLPTVGERQATAALCVKHLFSELSRFSVLNVFAENESSSKTRLDMVQRFFGVTPRPDLTETQAANLMRHLMLPFDLWTKDHLYTDIKRRVKSGESLEDICVGSTLEILNIKNDFQTSRGRPQYILTVQEGEPIIVEPTHRTKPEICRVLDAGLAQLDLSTVQQTPLTFTKVAAATRKRASATPFTQSIKKFSSPRVDIKTIVSAVVKPEPTSVESREKDQETISSRFFSSSSQPASSSPCITLKSAQRLSDSVSSTVQIREQKESTSSSQASSASQTSWVPLWMTARKRM
ncbi:protein Allo54 [Crucian carp herpesvirus]|uniref:Allo54 n=1 Tax=Cyprinid herpesvirus 2 TaxID=317878 RepID=A0A110A426_CYHV2|nr:Allo54 [Cyprinid herpesvirus 2]APB92909.1 protein Allo54 [Crucian carp herpesvirus]QAU54785.1 protein Allo54 [Cyprinid herpesvirus 2]